MDDETKGPNGKSGSYGKRPLWQWIVLYIIIGGIIYFAIYFFFLRGNNYYGGGRNSYQTQTQSSNTPAVNNAVLKTKNNSNVGQYLADPNGRTLYTYSADSQNVSNCMGSCLATWPAYIDSGSTANLPTNVSTTKRSDDGKMQFTYKGKPLYYFVSDSGSQVTGNNIGGFQVAKP